MKNKFDGYGIGYCYPDGTIKGWGDRIFPPMSDAEKAAHDREYAVVVAKREKLACDNINKNIALRKKLGEVKYAALQVRLLQEQVAAEKKNAGNCHR